MKMMITLTIYFDKYDDYFDDNDDEYFDDNDDRLPTDWLSCQSGLERTNVCLFVTEYMMKMMITVTIFW